MADGPSEVKEAAILLDGRWYDLHVYAPNCGAHHAHRHDHEDGSPGKPAHHHHDVRCRRIQAWLVPTDEADAPADPPVYQVAASV